MPLELSTRSESGVVVVNCHGRIVFGEEAAMLRDQVKLLLSESRQIVLNLKEVNYIDSGGVGILVSLFTSARATGGDLKLANVGRRVGEILQITKLATIFEIHNNPEAAIASFNQPVKPAVAG